jgi:hypothetical protein
MEELRKFKLGLILLVSINLCQFLAAFYWYFNESKDIGYIWFATAIVTAILFAIFLNKTWRDIKAGQPSEDERSKKIKMNAAGYSFFVSIYVWIGLLIFQDFFNSCSHVVSSGIILMAILFIASSTILNRRGDSV